MGEDNKYEYDTVSDTNNNPIVKFLGLAIGAAIILFAGYLYGTYKASEAFKVRAIDNGWACYQLVDIYSGKTTLVWADKQQ